MNVGFYCSCVVVHLVDQCWFFGLCPVELYTYKLMLISLRGSFVAMESKEL